MTPMTTTEQTFETSVAADGIILTDGAAAKVKTALESVGRDDLALRVGVQPGGEFAVHDSRRTIKRGGSATTSVCPRIRHQAARSGPAAGSSASNSRPAPTRTSRMRRATSIMGRGHFIPRQSSDKPLKGDA